MANLSKACVIAISCVVKAVGGVWLYGKNSAYQTLESCIIINRGCLDKDKEAGRDWRQNMSAREKHEYWRPICIKDPLSS